MENTLENMKTRDNKQTIDKSIEDLATEKQTLSKKLKQRRVNKIEELTFRCILYNSHDQRQESSSLNSFPRNQQLRSPQQLTRPMPQSPRPTDPRINRYNSPSPTPEQSHRDPPPRQITTSHRNQTDTTYQNRNHHYHDNTKTTLTRKQLWRSRKHLHNLF